MKIFKNLSILALVATCLTSCYTEVFIEDDTVAAPPTGPTLNQVLNQYEIWYVDIDRSSGDLVVPFLQKAFTISFRSGTIFTNNNLSGLGTHGAGFGLDVAVYDTFNYVLDVAHDFDGTYSFDVRTLSGNEIELYHPNTGATYILIGYQRSTFDYDLIFYNNIHYFLQEFEAWEKIYTSEEGTINPFDYENFMQFLPARDQGNFRSSEDGNGTPISNIFWDYDGIYDVNDVPGDFYLKTLTLDYNFPDTEYFDLVVLDDETIELFQVATGTTYRFRGKGYIQYRTSADGKSTRLPKLRKKTSTIKKEIEMLKAQKAAKYTL